MLYVDGDRTGADRAGLYVALVCALSEVSPACADRVMGEIEAAVGIRDRCDGCAFLGTCVRRDRVWTVHASRSVRIVG